MEFQMELTMRGNTQFAVGLSIRISAITAMMKANLVKASRFFLIAYTRLGSLPVFVL
jgi:hypothetical protein